MAPAQDIKRLTTAAAIAAGLATIAAAACGPPPPVMPSGPGSLDDAQRRAIELGDRVRSDQFEEYPEYPTSLLPPGAAFDGLPDNSIPAVAARMAKLASWREELRALDPAAVARSMQARLSYQVAREVVESTLHAQA